MTLVDRAAIATLYVSFVFLRRTQYWFYVGRMSGFSENMKTSSFSSNQTTNCLSASLPLQTLSFTCMFCLTYHTQLLYFHCTEALDHIPNHPILKPGQIVSVGLDKNTKLSAVFQRYVEFCNISTTGSANRVSVSDLEFVHMQVLSGNDTAEASALMKNDKITVRKIRTMEREAENETKRIQRDADKNYFSQLRHLMPDLGGGKTADVIFDCQGKLVDESGRNQQVLSTTVRGHSVLITKRCPWLGAIISKAKRDAEREHPQVLSRSTTPDEEKQQEEEQSVEEDGDDDNNEERPTKFQRVESDVKEEQPAEADEADDRSIDMVWNRDNNANESRRRAASAGATAIEDDEEEEERSNKRRDQDDDMRPESPVIAKQQHQQHPNELLWVKLPNHAPEAVKLLLEYCYTNRVIPLGQDAFVQSCKTKPHKNSGPVAPFQNHSSGSRRWPNNGLPTVSFSVALAGISLAEEAGLHRLSLQCEIAAARLVSSTNVVEALAMCTTQKQKTGNPLTKLQSAAMDVVLHGGPRGKMDIGRIPDFPNALNEKAALIVPALLNGTMEAVSEYEKTRAGKRNKLNAANKTPVTFDDLDRQDCYKRERERVKRRIQRNNEDYLDMEEEEDDHDDDPMDLDVIYEHGWIGETVKRAMDRMPHHNSSISHPFFPAGNNNSTSSRSNRRRRS